MAIYEVKFIIAVPENDEDVAERIVAFYHHNGYSSHPVEDANAPLQFLRGKKRAGWWSSNMTELFTDLTVSINGQQAELYYRVDISGQRLTDDDRAFFQREADACEKAAQKDAKPVDLRPAEGVRVRAVQKDLRRDGIWYGVAAFIALVVMIVVADLLGFTLL